MMKEGLKVGQLEWFFNWLMTSFFTYFPTLYVVLN